MREVAKSENLPIYDSYILVSDIHVRYSNNKSNNWCTEEWFNRRLRLPSETPEATFYGGRQYTTTNNLPALIGLNFYTDLMNSTPENFVYARQIKEG